MSFESIFEGLPPSTTDVQKLQDIDITYIENVGCLTVLYIFYVVGTSFCGLIMEGRIFYAQFTLHSPPSTLKALNHIIFFYFQNFEVK